MHPTILDQRPKPGKYYDDHGLVVVVRKTGSIYFEQRYTYRKKRYTVGLGAYSGVSLAETREQAGISLAETREQAGISLAEARAQAIENLRLVRAGVDPITDKRRPPTPILSEACAKEIEDLKAGWSNARTFLIHRQALEKHIYPTLGKRLVSDISTDDLASVLKPIGKAAPSTVRRLCQVLNAVLRSASVSGLRADNPLNKRLVRAVSRASRRRKHHPALPHSEVAGALAAIRSSGASVAVRLAFEFLILTAVRSGEIRGAVWDEIDFERALWTIPAERAKTDEEHLVPLAPQSIRVLRSARELGDGTGLVFQTKSGREIKNSSFSQLVRDLGIACVPHGMRSSFRDWCGETGVDRQVAEACLAHRVGDSVELAYLRWDFLERRRPVMDAWAAYVTDNMDGEESAPRFSA